MSKHSRSKREIQEGKDFVQPKNERYDHVITAAEAEKNRSYKQNGDSHGK